VNSRWADAACMRPIPSRACGLGSARRTRTDRPSAEQTESLRRWWTRHRQAPARQEQLFDRHSQAAFAAFAAGRAREGTRRFSRAGRWTELGGGGAMSRSSHYVQLESDGTTIVPRLAPRRYSVGGTTDGKEWAREVSVPADTEIRTRSRGAPTLASALWETTPTQERTAPWPSRGDPNPSSRC
jgi:hypothetical protein